MNDFLSRIRKHIEHIKKVGTLCSTEETTKQALILPLLDILGFSPYDPTKVRAEYCADFPGAKASERVDYALFCQGSPVVFIEAKAYTEKLLNHSPQLSRYFNSSTSTSIGIITNGREWRFFTDLNHKNIMDAEPFLIIDMLNSNDSELSNLYRFRHDEFEPDKLRCMAEENTYFSAFSSVISSSLKNVDIDFVRFVASKSAINRQLTAKFLESITPIVKQAIEKSVSDMVVSGLSSPEPIKVEAKETPDEAELPGSIDEVNPDNPKIITTVTEKQLLSIAQDILGQDSNLSIKDTETYCSILFDGRVNRWIFRYRGDRKNPTIELCVPITSERESEIQRSGLEILASKQIVLDKPEYLYRIVGILFDCYEYCTNDENFRIKKNVKLN